MPSKPSFLFVILLVVAVFLVGVTSVDAARKPKKPSGFIVLDSSDPPKVVGKVVDVDPAESTASVLFSVNGNLVLHEVREDGFFQIRQLTFLTDDCTGDGLSGDSPGTVGTEVFGNLSSLIAPTAFGNPSKTLYIERPNSEITILNTPMYRLSVDSDCAILNRTNATVVVMDPVVNLDALFVPPFAVVGDAPTLP